MGWEFHPASKDFQRFANDWDRLNAELYANHPFFDSRFVGPLLKHFAAGNEKIGVYRKNGVIRGALILCPAGFGKWVTFRPGQMQATPILLPDVTPLDELFDALPGMVWSIELHAVDPRYSPDVRKIDRPLLCTSQATTIGIAPEIGFQEYWSERPKKLVANVDRYSRKAVKEFAEPIFRTLEATEEMRGGVERFGHLESAGWKGKAGTAISVDNAQGAFYSEALEQFAATGQAAVFELYVGEQLASSRLVIRSEHMAIFLKTTYDESLSRIAPGRLLLRAVIAQLREHAPRQAIEFYTNATRDQKEWAGFECTLENICLFRSTFVANSYNLLKALRRRFRGARHRRSDEDPASDVQTCNDAGFFADNGYDIKEFSPRDDIDLSLDWFSLMQMHVFANDPGVRFYFTAGENKTVRSILPVRLNVQGQTRRIDSLGNYYSALYAPLVSAHGGNEDIQAMLLRATRDHRGAHVMSFLPMDVDSPTYVMLENELRATGWIPFRFRCFGNWYLKVTGDWEDYLARRSANLRSSIRRRTRKFATEGGLLKLVSGGEELESAIRDFLEVYSASWKQPEPYPEFIPGLIRHLASLGMLRLGIAQLGGKPIAAQLWIAGRRKASICKVAYHEAYAGYSPGTVLTAFLLQHVIDRDGVKEVDFLIGDDEYKKIWMSDRRERWGIVAYNPRTAVGICMYAVEVAGRFFKLIKHNREAVQVASKRQENDPDPSSHTRSQRAKQFAPAKRR